MSNRNERDNRNINEEPIDDIGIRGWTAPRALNYNADATIDDRSCRYVDEAPPPLTPPI